MGSGYDVIIAALVSGSSAFLRMEVLTVSSVNPASANICSSSMKNCSIRFPPCLYP